jgi:hypothetical protein
MARVKRHGRTSMSNSGWDIAMQRINNEFEIAQFLASALVRKIAANKFRLAAADRSKFEQLPDKVIERIEEIVHEAYIEAGDDVSGAILRENLWQQATSARREMVASGELIPEDEFLARLNVTKRRLNKLLADGSIFTLEVDGAVYYPALLADPVHNRQRLQVICRIIAPAPADSRLGFLTSRRGSLGDRSPLDMLDSDDDFKALSRRAAAWAAEWSRTAVKLYEGTLETEPKEVEPMYTAVAEIDPRSALWDRASEALHVHGYQWPLGPYSEVRSFTLFVERQTAGDSAPIPEASVQIAVDGELMQIRIVAAAGTALHCETMPSSKTTSLIDVAKRVISHLLAMSVGR